MMIKWHVLVSLECRAESMTVTLNTEEPFTGRLFSQGGSKCQTLGTARKIMDLQFPTLLCIYKHRRSCYRDNGDKSPLTRKGSCLSGTRNYWSIELNTRESVHDTWKAVVSNKCMSLLITLWYMKAQKDTLSLPVLDCQHATFPTNSWCHTLISPKGCLSQMLY